jgi:hypothetical protein
VARSTPVSTADGRAEENARAEGIALDRQSTVPDTIDNRLYQTSTMQRHVHDDDSRQTAAETARQTTTETGRRAPSGSNNTDHTDSDNTDYTDSDTTDHTGSDDTDCTGSDNTDHIGSEDTVHAGREDTVHTEQTGHGDTEEQNTGGDGSSLVSRVAVTWVELLLVGFSGAAVGGATSGPPTFVVYLATTLLSVGVLLYNVDRLVRDRLAAVS